jgi:hypothetical protein
MGQVVLGEGKARFQSRDAISREGLIRRESQGREWFHI